MKSYLVFMEGVSQTDFIVDKPKHNLKIAQDAGEALGHTVNVTALGVKGKGIACYDREHGIMTLNSSHPHWKDPVNNQKRRYEEGISSTDHPLHSLYHEIGHKLYDAPSNWAFDNHKNIAQEVSQYASRKPSEFVAETHAGMVVGKEYSPEVQRLFKDYAQPIKQLGKLPPHLARFATQKLGFNEESCMKSYKELTENPVAGNSVGSGAVAGLSVTSLPGPANSKGIVGRGTAPVKGGDEIDLKKKKRAKNLINALQSH